FFFDDRQERGVLLFGSELVEKRIARADVGRGDCWWRLLFGAWFKDGVTEQDPDRRKRNREPSRVFHRFPRTPGATWRHGLPHGEIARSYGLYWQRCAGKGRVASGSGTGP